jgi:hypothetical protein
MASHVPIASTTYIPIIKSSIPSDAKLPAPIIKETRVPRELQKVFIESNRGGFVKRAPPGVNFTRKWFDKTKTPEWKKKNRLLFGSREKHFVFDKNLPPSHRGGEGEKDAAGCGDTRWASACTQEKVNTAPRAPARRSQEECSPHAPPQGKLYAAPRPLTLLMSVSRLSISATSSEGSPIARPPKRCEQMNAQPPKRPVRSTGNTLVCEDD